VLSETPMLAVILDVFGELAGDKSMGNRGGRDVYGNVKPTLVYLCLSYVYM